MEDAFRTVGDIRPEPRDSDSRPGPVGRIRRIAGPTAADGVSSDLKAAKTYRKAIRAALRTYSSHLQADCKVLDRHAD